MSEFSAYVRYDPQGSITQSGTMETALIIAAMARGEAILPFDGDEAAGPHYVDMGTLTIQPLLPSSAVLNGTTITGITLPAALRVNGQLIPLDDTTAELAADIPGTYRVELNEAGHRPITFEVQISG